jgi:hypothetical protein
MRPTKVTRSRHKNVKESAIDVLNLLCGGTTKSNKRAKIGTLGSM